MLKKIQSLSDYADSFERNDSRGDHTDKQRIIISKNTLLSDEEWFYCDNNCPYITNNYKNLYKHKRRRHIPLELQNSFQCDYWAFKTNCVANLKQHKSRKHTN